VELLKRNGWSVPGPRGGVCQGPGGGVCQGPGVECARAQGWSVPGPRGLGGAPESRVIKCIGKTSFDLRSGDN
jgi:hypothetical protein